MSKDLVVPQDTNLAAAHEAPTFMERHTAFTKALQLVDDDRCNRRIPRFMQGMPWASEDDEIAERIIAKMLAADDPYSIDNAGETLSGKGLIGRKITVHDVRVAPSSKPGGWGAYLICDVTVDSDDAHDVMTVGAKEAAAKLAYAWFMGDLPIAGTMTVVTETGEGNQVLGFVVERAL